MKNVCEFLKELVGRSRLLLLESFGREQNYNFERDYTSWIESCVQVLGCAELTEYQEKLKQLQD